MNYKDKYKKYKLKSEMQCDAKIMLGGNKHFKIAEKKIKSVECINDKIYVLNNIDDETLDEKSQFPIGSITKLFTIIALLILHDNKKININDTFEKYLDNNELRKIKIMSVTNHTSGMKNIKDNFDYVFGSEYKYKNATDAYLSFNKEKLITEKKDIFNYSNIGYIILGALIEKITGIDYRNVIENFILDPLNIKNATFEKTNIILYNKECKKLNKYEKYTRTFASSAGQIAASIEDLTKFSKFTELLSKKSLEILKKTYVFTKTNDDFYMISHTGGINGGGSSLKIKYNKKWRLEHIGIKLNTIA
jgi:CubicO group peptidase (beta-lactamase class C family)